MTDRQFNELIAVLEKVLSKTYTITSAADWPILIIVLGVLFTIIAFMWIDLRTIVKDNKSEWKVELAKVEADSKSEDQKIWTAMHDCQNDCCPRRKN